MRENRTCGSEGGEGYGPSRPLSIGEAGPVRANKGYLAWVPEFDTATRRAPVSRPVMRIVGFAWHGRERTPRSGTRSVLA